MEIPMNGDTYEIDLTVRTQAVMRHWNKFLSLSSNIAFKLPYGTTFPPQLNLKLSYQCVIIVVLYVGKAFKLASFRLAGFFLHALIFTA